MWEYPEKEIEMRAYGGRRSVHDWMLVLVLLLLAVAILNAAGWMLNLFSRIPPYDEIVHFVTPLTLVAIASTLIYRSGGRDEFFSSTTRALLTGAMLGLIGAIAWELFEVLLVRLFPGIDFPTPPLDTAVDVMLGTAGGAVGARLVDWRLDRVRRR
ncbi:MAG: hypothetical protein M3Q29_13175 [Chloroflexota bacterium]|nr:hypothetical protein [Chloroflexota bacterium]